MNRLIVSVAALIGLLVALGGQCEPIDLQEYMASLQGALERGLAHLEPEQKRELEAYVDIVSTTPEGERWWDRFKNAAIAYRQSKGKEANKSEAQRNKILDFLEDSCRALYKELHEFIRMDGTSLMEATKNSQLDKWRMAHTSCTSFTATCGRLAVVREEWLSRHSPYNVWTRSRDNFKLVRGL